MRKVLRIILLLLLLTGPAFLFSTLVHQKKIILNHPSTRKYPVRGIDVSRYQGKINWQKISKQKITFAFIKATEGSNHIDDKFSYNWKKALDTDLKIGAYHFFSFDSPGKSQAKNFISTVNKVEGMMPPVIDVEFYGNKAKNLPDPKAVKRELQVLLNDLEENYGKKPIIYATLKSYHLYIKAYFSDYPIWIRNVYYPPNIDLKNKWTFWQYTDQQILEGYESDQKYIDMNVFNGDENDFESFFMK